MRRSVVAASVRIVFPSDGRVIDVHFREALGLAGPSLDVRTGAGVSPAEAIKALSALRDVLGDYLPNDDGGPKPRRRILFNEEEKP